MDIFIDNIDKSYNGKYVLDHVTLKIHHGECVGVMGKSGSGKSTLARMVIGLEHPDSGKIYYDGKTVNSLNRKERQELRKKVQIVFQNAFGAVNPYFTVKEVLLEPLEIMEKRAYTDSEKMELMKKIMKMVGLEHIDFGQKARSLSGGQLQRLCIARALIVTPDVIIFDESLSGLDYLVQKQILRLLGKLKDQLGLTYIFIVHDFLLAYYLCNRVVILNSGKIEEILDITNENFPVVSSTGKDILCEFLEKREMDASERVE